MERDAGEVSLDHCPGCGLAMLAEDTLIRIHGHYYHYGCATYRRRHADSLVAGTPQGDERDG